MTDVIRRTIFGHALPTTKMQGKQHTVVPIVNGTLIDAITTVEVESLWMMTRHDMASMDPVCELLSSGRSLRQERHSACIEAASKQHRTASKQQQQKAAAAEGGGTPAAAPPTNRMRERQHKAKSPRRAAQFKCTLPPPWSQNPSPCQSRVNEHSNTTPSQSVLRQTHHAPSEREE